MLGFYEKFELRDASSEIIDWCWPMQHHRQSMLAFCADPVTQPHFLRFANAVSNDLTFHMEEALKCVDGVREIEKEQENEAEWAALEPSVRAEKEKNLSTHYGHGRHYLSRTMQQVCLMALVTEQTVPVWLCKDLRNRLAGSLGHLLDRLVGAGRAKLRVKDSKSEARALSCYGLRPQH